MEDKVTVQGKLTDYLKLLNQIFEKEMKTAFIEELRAD